MTKRYVLSRDDLVNLFYEFTSYSSQEVRKLMACNRMLMLSDRINMINSFLDNYLIEFPINKLLDEVEQKFTSYTGGTFEDIYNAMKEEQPEEKKNYKKNEQNVKDYLENMDQHLK